MTNDGLNTLVGARPERSPRDAENHLVSSAGVNYVYDGDGRRVEKATTGPPLTPTKLYWYGTGSDALDETDAAGNTNNSSFNEYVFFGDKRIARRDSSNNAFYYFPDHLDSSRFASTTMQTLYSDTAYSPYGETYAQSGAIDPSFTGENQDATAGLYDFLFREQDPNQSRWTSPDPSGLDAVDPTNPQSFNRYAYVLNHPMELVDPLGLFGNVPNGCSVIYPEKGKPGVIVCPGDPNPDPRGPGAPPSPAPGRGGSGGIGGSGGTAASQSKAQHCAAAKAKVASLKQQQNTIDPNKLLKENLGELAVGAGIGCGIEAVPAWAAPIPGLTLGGCLHGAIAGTMTAEAVFALSHVSEIADSTSTGAQLLIAEVKAATACHQ